jgi:uncharacterized protein (TIGR02246 family)
MGATGDKVKARYSFIYTYEYGQWKILHHHSSAMPESGKKAAAENQITKDQVKNLFYLWNDALDTLDSDAVAKRYSKNAVLLPTVSDTPRTDYESIKDYFDNFLKLQPQGQILESHVLVGDNWAKDVGIYEFTMRANGSKVKARYSFVYVLEDGEWKISHHHSSAMPESKIGKTITKDQVQGLFKLWNDALATLDADVVAMRYAKDGVLLPTVVRIKKVHMHEQSFVHFRMPMNLTKKKCRHFSLSRVTFHEQITNRSRITSKHSCKRNHRALSLNRTHWSVKTGARMLAFTNSPWAPMAPK